LTIFGYQCGFFSYGIDAADPLHTGNFMVQTSLDQYIPVNNDGLLYILFYI